MVNVSWATPEAIARLTPAQTQCLASERAPGEGRLTSMEEYEAATERRHAEEAAWSA